MRRIYTEEQKARNKIYKAKWTQENPEKIKAITAKFSENNPDYKKEHSKKWHEANPGYSKVMSQKHDLGYWVVYIITNYNGLKDNYCGQTQNIYRRMIKHKHLGKLNTETHEVLEKFDCKIEALAFEATLHSDGYHGKNTGGH